MFSNSIKQFAQKPSVCFQHCEGVFLNEAEFSLNYYFKVSVWCLFRFHLRAKVLQIRRNCLDAVSNCAMKVQGRFTKKIFSTAMYRICSWYSSGVCQWVVPCMLCVLKNDTSFVKMVWQVLYTLRGFFFSNTNIRLFRKYIFGKFFIIKHQSRKHQMKTSMLQISSKHFAAKNEKHFSGTEWVLDFQCYFCNQP